MRVARRPHRSRRKISVGQWQLASRQRTSGRPRRTSRTMLGSVPPSRRPGNRNDVGGSGSDSGGSGGGGGGSVSPVPGAVIGAHFGEYGSWSRYHTGLDFRAAYGTPIRAVKAGVVLYAGNSGDWAGNHVAIKHADGMTTMYSHMSSMAVRAGQSVGAGQVIGRVGRRAEPSEPTCTSSSTPPGREVRRCLQGHQPAALACLHRGHYPLAAGGKWRQHRRDVRAADLQEEMAEHAFRSARSDEDGGNRANIAASEASNPTQRDVRAAQGSGTRSSQLQKENTAELSRSACTRVTDPLLFRKRPPFVTKRGPPAADDHSTCTAAEAGLGEPVVVRGDWSAQLVVGARCASRLDGEHQNGQEELAASRSGSHGGVLLGLGVAGSLVLTGAAQHTTLTATVATTDLAKQTSRGSERARLDPAKVKSLADQRAELLSKIDSQVSKASTDKSARARDKALEDVSAATRKQAVLLSRGRSARTNQLPPARRRFQRSRLPASHERLQHRRSFRTGRHVGPIPHGFGLFFSRGYASFTLRCIGRRHQRRNRPRQRMGRQLRRNQVPGWHPHPDGAHVDGLRQRRSNRVSVPDRRRDRADGPDLRATRAPGGLPGGRDPRRHLQRGQPVPWLNAHGLKP